MYITMSTLRLFTTAGRLATARLMSDGSLLQVYPIQKRYDTQDKWQAQWPQEAWVERTESAPPKPKEPSRALRGRFEREMMEFFEPDFVALVQDVSLKAPPEPKIVLHAKDGVEWEIERSLDFLKPPTLKKNGIPFGSHYAAQSYSPALTSCRWWMMLAFVQPD